MLDKKSGRSWLNAPNDSRLFKIFVPNEESLLSQHCWSHQSGRPEIESSPARIVMRWKSLYTAQGKELAIAVRVTVSLGAEDSEARFEIAVDNESPFLIHEVFFPYIGGLLPGDKADKTGLTIGATRRLEVTKMLAKGGQAVDRNNRRGFNMANSAQMYLPMIDYSDDTGGFSYIHYPSAPRHGVFYWEDQNDTRGLEPRPSFSWVHWPYLETGKTWQSDPTGIAPHSGDWHCTAERLRQWLKSRWHSPVTAPDLRSSLGIFHVSFRDWSGAQVSSVDEIEAMARECKEAGIDHILIWDMVLMGYYIRAGKRGLFDDEDPGHLERLREAVARVRALGMRVSGFVNMRLMSARSDESGEIREKFAIRSLYGTPMLEPYQYETIRSESSIWLNNFNYTQGLVNLCQQHPEFQSWALDKAKKYLELGFNSFAFDQPAMNFVCFARDHGHSFPGYGHEGACDWIRKASAMVKKEHPRAVTMGEDLDLWNSQVIDINFSWRYFFNMPEVISYVLPDSVLLSSIDGRSEADELPRAFARGHLIGPSIGWTKPLSAEPEFFQKLKRLAALRKKTAAYTVEARFRDQDGLSVECSAPAAASESGRAASFLDGESGASLKGQVAAYVYEAIGTIAVIVADCTPMEKKDGGCAVKLMLDMKKLDRATDGKIVLHSEYGGEKVLPLRESGGIVSLEIELKRWECVVVEVRCGHSSG